MKNRAVIVLVSIAIVIGSSMTAFVSSASAGTWSTGMFTVNRCSWAAQQHCRWVATELNFRPTLACTRITFKGNAIPSADFTLEERSPRPGLTTFGWGVETRLALTNWDWQNNSNWRYYKTC